MATRKINQVSFNTGQLGPFMDGRVDSQLYKTGLEECSNMLLLPQGGMQKRKGFEFISAHPDNDTTPDGSTALTTNGFHIKTRMFPFKFSDGQEYVLVMEPYDSTISNTATIHIFYNDQRIDTIVNGVAGNIVPVDVDQIDDLRFTQSFDYMIFTHPNVRPFQIVRGTTNTDWTCVYLEFDHIPQANFNFDATLSPASASGNNVNFTLAGGTYRWVDAAWPDGHVGMKLLINGGMARIKSISSSTVAVCDVEYDLVDTETAEGHEWEIDAFSNLSTSLGGGWPRSVSFHQNRLIFGGSRDKPQTIFGSQSGDFFNFDNYTRAVDGTGNVTGEITDDAGIQFTISSDQLNIIRHMVSQQSLFIFTSDGEFDMSGEPVTPSNVLVRQQTRYGIGGGRTTPIVVDNEVLFNDKSGKQTRAFVYNFNTDAYSAKNYSLIHHDILTGATELAYLNNYANNNTNYAFALNSDGTLGVLGVNVEFSVVGWNKWTTNGNFKGLCVVDDSLYALTQRYSSDGSTLNTGVFLEKLTEQEIYLDSFQTTEVSGQTFTGADGLQLQTVQVVADGLVHPDVTVDAAGNFSLSRVSSSTQIGHTYTALARSLNLVVAAGGQATLGEKVRKVLVDLQLYQTKNLKVDGITVPFRNLGSTLLNQGISGYNGMKRVRLPGYSTTPQITLTIPDPLPCTVLSMTTEVKFGVGGLTEN